MNRLIRFLAAAVAASVWCIAGPVKADGIDQLARFVGTWASPGTLLDTPYSKAGSAMATTTCAWSIDHVFMICQQSVTINGKASHALSIYTYDALGQYHFFNVRPDGSDGSIIQVDKDTITYTNSFVDKGKPVTIRTLNVWSSPTSYRWRTEYSTDSEKSWALMGSGTSQRQ